MEAVLSELVAVDDLVKFEKKFQTEQAGGSVSHSTQFEYAWCLVRSKYNDDIRKGIGLLEELLHKGSKEEQRDYVFYLAVGNYRLKEYEKALKYVRGLLQTEPQNNQAKELKCLIDKAMKKGPPRLPSSHHVSCCRDIWILPGCAGAADARSDASQQLLACVFCPWQCHYNIDHL
uniref:Mitochondrial fission 1 protein n=1 Tax=Sarcophilus harrisii TaxID=9305 RepID=A0A7N4PJT0_SARHA